MKNSADLGGCYPPWPLASVDNTLLDLQNSSYPTQPHSIIAKYAGIGIVQDKKKRRKSNFFQPHYFYNIAVTNLEPKENKVDKQCHMHRQQMYTAGIL